MHFSLERYLSTLSLILLSTMSDNIFLIEESNVKGLRFAAVPFGCWVFEWHLIVQI